MFETNEDYRAYAYSQEGEDMILDRFFMDQSKGFYVDIGAHHPKRYSNTYLFYRKGWHGINIDAAPGSMALFARHRPRDVNLEIAIAVQSGRQQTFCVFNEPALNTFDQALAEQREKSPHQYRIVSRQQVTTQRLEEVLKAHLPAGTRIDFMTVDVEGLDLEVLRSNDWEKFRPSYVLAESFGVALADLAKDPVTSFLHEKRYVPCAKTVNTVIYRGIE